MDYQSIKELTERLLARKYGDGMIMIQEKEYKTEYCYHFDLNLYHTPYTTKPVPKDSITKVMHFEHIHNEEISDDRKFKVYEDLYYYLLIWGIEKCLETSKKLKEWQKH